MWRPRIDISILLVAAALTFCPHSTVVAKAEPSAERTTYNCRSIFEGPDGSAVQASIDFMADGTIFQQDASWWPPTESGVKAPREDAKPPEVIFVYETVTSVELGEPAGILVSPGTRYGGPETDRTSIAIDGVVVWRGWADGPGSQVIVPVGIRSLPGLGTAKTVTVTDFANGTPTGSETYRITDLADRDAAYLKARREIEELASHPTDCSSMTVPADWPDPDIWQLSEPTGP